MGQSEATDFYAADLDGDALEMGEPTEHQQAAYGAMLAVVLGRSGMLLDRHQAERLRDYLTERLRDA